MAHTVDRSVLAYAAPALPLALLAITVYVYIPKFYAEVIGLELAFIGQVILFSRIFDAIIDPVLGRISDHSTSRFGRRRPWIAVAVVPLALCFFFLMAPSEIPFSVSPSIAFVVLTLLLFIFWTMVSVPFEALGAEISFDYHFRTVLFGYREGALVLGTLLAAVFPWLLEEYFPTLDTAKRYEMLGVLYGAILLAAAFTCVRVIKEKVWQTAQLPTEKFFEGLSHVLSNRPFIILLVSYTIGALGGALPASLILFYVEDVLASDKGSLFLILYFGVGLLFLPMWIGVSRLIGKKRAWIVAMLINTGAFFAVFFLGAGDLWLYGLLVSLSAIGYGATLALPSSMQADVIDYDESKHGTRKEGQFIGLWSIFKKLSAALGAGVGFIVLDAVGYQPQSAQHSENALFWLRFLYAGVPCICNFIAICVALSYPLDEKAHGKIRKDIAARLESLA